MRSRRTCLLTMLLSVFFTLSFAVQLMAADTLTVGVPVDRCPIFYVDNGEIVGIGVDLMRAVCEEAGYVASFREIEEETLKAVSESIMPESYKKTLADFFAGKTFSVLPT